jgi:exopolysaccharide biosynthesis protein
MNHVMSDALNGLLAVDKVYWLHDTDMVAPRPKQENFGETDDPQAMVPVIERAQKLLDGQELIFSTDAQLREDSVITYYLDETIFCVTWQHTVGKAVYTCSEVKIAHPSQFRRFLSDGKFGSGKLYRTTEMAASVNAVTASSGDYYAYRGYGNLVYNGEVKLSEIRYLDTCYVDSNGDLLMLDMGQLYRKEDIQNFVEEKDIRFSLAFGPILVEDGKVVAKHHYALGETDRYYSRAALCQIDSLHYMLVTVNRKGQDVTQFAKHLKELGVRDAYALDGGQTSTIVTGNKLMNPVDYGGEREISDIIYFATAVPDGG